jgi:GNAT superfamily N-acetyltransferase
MYSVRASREEDLTKLAAVERCAGQLFATTAHAYLCHAPTLSMEILARQHQLGAVWVAADEHDEPIGFAVAGELSGEAYVYEIDVDPRHGRRGVGRMLMRAAADWARAAGYATLTLSTCVDVPWNAPFYASLGFEVVKEAELTPAMVETRRHEAKAGFLVDRRVFMRSSLEQPD